MRSGATTLLVSTRDLGDVARASPRLTPERVERRLGEQRHALLEERGARVLGAELAAR